MKIIHYVYLTVIAYIGFVVFALVGFGILTSWRFFDTPPYGDYVGVGCMIFSVALAMMGWYSTGQYDKKIAEQKRDLERDDGKSEDLLEDTSKVKLLA